MNYELKFVPLQFVKAMRRLKKKIFLGVSGGVVLLLGAVRLLYPGVTGEAMPEPLPGETPAVVSQGCDSMQAEAVQPSGGIAADPIRGDELKNLSSDPQERVKWHPVRSVPSYSDCFPDVQDVQIVAARRWGVSPVRDREEAEQRKQELVYIGANPYYTIDRGMSHSIPYLVPRAASLLSAIGRSYLDSLYVKGIPMHKIIVSSVLRTEADVARLTRRNGNASDQSCHRFGTTFDVCYNRYETVTPPGQPDRRTVQNDTLKWVLSEVLRDFREQGRCYIKYEVKQGCFHITVR